MPEKAYTQSISTAQFTETPALELEQPTGDVYVEGWDRQEIEVSVSDEGLFEIEQNGSQVVIRNRPGKFKLVDFLEPAANELREIGVDLSKVTAHVERTIERTIERKVERGMRRMGRGFNFNMDLSNWRGGRDYHIMVPTNCDITLRTSSGDIELVGVSGTLFVQSSSGDIKARILSGNTLITTASGDITVEDLEGKLAVRTASGDVKALTIGADEVSANTASGDVELDLVRLPAGNFEVKTVSGSLNLFMIRDAAFTAEIHTLSGSVACGFPRDRVEYTARHKRETVLNINGGGKTFQVQSVSGDVTIRPRKFESQPTAQPTISSPTLSAGSPTIRTDRPQGAPTMDLSRTQSANSSGESARVDPAHGDITQSEGYVARQQAELEILQRVERGELTPQEALAALTSLDSD